MSPWLRLAWKEFWLPFRYRKPGCPGGRDFVWLSTFMALMLTLMLLLLASREGMLNRFVDVLLGNVPGYGVPISVTNNMLSKGGINAIDTAVLSKMRALENRIPGLQVYPHRNLEAVLHPLIGLPAEDIWENKQDGSKFGPDFDGWAVYTDDPLWKADSSKTLPMEIIMSRSLFKKYFNYGAYRNALREELPSELFHALAANFKISAQSLNKLRNDHLPAEILQQLKTLTDTIYSTEDDFSRELEKAIGEEQVTQYKTLILKHSTFPTADENAPVPFDELWLRVKVGYARELFRFKVTWIERFPVIDKITYAFPLATYQALKAAHNFPELRYFPEGNGEGGKRFKQILIEMPLEQDEDTFLKTCQEFVAKLGGEMTDYRGDMLIVFKYPLRKVWLDAYAQQYNLKYDSMETIIGDKISFADGKIFLPCGRLPNQYLRDANFTSCSGDMLQPLGLDITAKGSGFRYALVYVPDRRFLSLTVDQLEQVKEKALSIHSAYQDALNRFGFLSEMLVAMEKPYSWFLAVFLVAFLGVQIGTLIGHHRHRYGVFLAKGMEWWQIYAMLWFQILLAMVLGMFVALSVITAARIYLQQIIAPVADRYTATLSIADLNLLPLTYAEYWVASGIVLLLAWLLATIILYLMPLRRQTHPAMLLQ